MVLYINKLVPAELANPVNLVSPVAVKAPNTLVEPVILILLPDILVNKYIKLPSPSAYDNADPLTNNELSGFGVVVVLSIKPIV